MDLAQKKLTKKEWEMLEVPVRPEELKILKLIGDGYNNLNISYNNISSLIGFMKISNNYKIFNQYLYNRYFAPIFCNYQKKYKIQKYNITFKKVKMNKANIIRINNCDKRINKNKIFEFILIKILKKYLKSDKDKSGQYYYSLTHLIKNKILPTKIIL